MCDDMEEGTGSLKDLASRNRNVFLALVDRYLAAGNPVGSRTLSRDVKENISAATIRNTMQDLEMLGLLSSPHVSAGRIPTDIGLRLYVDELLEVMEIGDEDREKIDAEVDRNEVDLDRLLSRTGSVLSRLTRTASLVLTPKTEMPIKHIGFVSLGSERALVVLVTSDGSVENRVFKPAPGQTPSSMREAANFLNAIANGLTISELRDTFKDEISKRRRELDSIAEDLVERGLAVWENGGQADERLIVRGRSNLLGSKEFLGDIRRIRELFDDLERKRDIAEFLKLVEGSDGVKIFIGSENKLFSLSGSTLVVSPYMDAQRRIIGAVGVIGPTRLNYGKIVPVVDYTAQLVGRTVSGRMESGGSRE